MIKIRLFVKEDSKLVSNLLLSIFRKFNLDGVSEEGLTFFNKNHSPDKIRRDWAMTYRIVKKNKEAILVHPFAYSLVAVNKDSIVAVGRAKYDGWITHCFVSQKYMGKGLGKTLIERMEKWINKKPEIDFIKLNASPLAVGFYENLGYKKTTGKRMYHGLPIYPMKKDIR